MEKNKAGRDEWYSSLNRIVIDGPTGNAKGELVNKGGEEAGKPCRFLREAGLIKQKEQVQWPCR